LPPFGEPAVPFAPGYGVEIGILIDTYDKLGLEAIAQVNLGVRTSAWHERYSGARMHEVSDFSGARNFFSNYEPLTREAARHMRLFIAGSAPLLIETFTEWQRRTGHRSSIAQAGGDHARRRQVVFAHMADGDRRRLPVPRRHSDLVRRF